MCFRKRNGEVLDYVVHALLRELKYMSHNAYHLADVEGVIFGAFILRFHSPVGVEVGARCEFKLFAVVITFFHISLEILMCQCIM